jgi:Fe-S-cluster containining protein
MRYVDPGTLEHLPGTRLEEKDTFCFRCHPEVACFNRCCRNLNLFLYPYDVLRLKKRLGVSSDTFLEQYVDVVLRDFNFFPEVLLRMSSDAEKTCPFLTPAGCSVYPDRPDACRTFPLEQGVLFDAAKSEERMVYFFRPPDFCMGQYEEKVWTPATWEIDQEAVVYHRMTARWAELKRLFQQNPWGAEGPSGSRAKMAFMAVYNLDRFRQFVFQSSFLGRYALKPALQKKIKKDDTVLLKFSLEWVRFFVWGIRSDVIRPR